MGAWFLISKCLLVSPPHVLVETHNALQSYFLPVQSGVDVCAHPLGLTRLRCRVDPEADLSKGAGLLFPVVSVTAVPGQGV